MTRRILPLVVALVAGAALLVVTPPVAAATGASSASGGPVSRAATASVSPSTGLAQGHPVTVTASGLQASELYHVTQCGEEACQRLPSPPPAIFVASNSGIGTASASGTISVGLQVDRTFSVGEVDVDCATEACRIEVRGPILTTAAPVATAPLSFTPSGDYAWPQPTLVLEHTTGLIGGQRTTAVGTGYDPWNGGLHWNFARATAAVEMCRAVPAPTAADCETPERTFDAWLSGEGDVVAVEGDLHAAVRVRRHLTLPSGPWDCARQGCTLALSQGGNPVSQRKRVRFAPEWAPWPGPEAFMSDAVQRVAGRRLTAAQRSALRAALGARTTTGVQALVDAASTSRLDPTVGEVVRLYRAFFGRSVDAAGLTYWVDRMGEGASPLRVARRFGSTPEFHAQYDGLNDTQVVARVYGRTLGRAPSAAESSYWTGRLAAGLSRVDLVYSFARTPELRSRTAGASQAAIITWSLRYEVWPGLSPFAAAERMLATIVPDPPLVP